MTEVHSTELADLRARVTTLTTLVSTLAWERDVGIGYDHGYVCRFCSARIHTVFDGAFECCHDDTCPTQQVDPRA